MILVDTSILVDILRKNEETLNNINKLGTISLNTTEISMMELYFGIFGTKYYSDKPNLKKKRIEEINNLISKYNVLSFDRKAAIKTADIMGFLKLNGKLTDFRDGMIAGIGIANGISKILTHNTKHFENIPEIEVLTM